MSKKKVLIPTRGVMALDIIDSLKGIGLETILLHSPEDDHSLPVKLADRSYKFFSSRLEDSYHDMDSIIEKAIQLQVDYIHPGYGYLAENPDFSRLCENNNIAFIGPKSDVLEKVQNKLTLKKIAEEMGINTLPYSGPLRTVMDLDTAPNDLKYPCLLKPIRGTGGKGIRIIEHKKDAKEQLKEILKREQYQVQGLFLEEYAPNGHHIEIPFFRDVTGNLLLLPEIESSIQRRFQKIFQESPSINISEDLRASIYQDAQKIIEKINYVGLGYIEFIVETGRSYLLEINPSYQVNSAIPEVHTISNFIKKQFAIALGEPLYGFATRTMNGMEIVKPKYNVMLVSLMAENPFDNFQPSSGTVTEFYHYSTIRNMFKTSLYAGARMSPLYDPYIGKIVTFSSKRENTISDMNNFMSHIIIKGVKTNLPFLRHLLHSESLSKGETVINFIKGISNFAQRIRSEEEIMTAGALLSAAFHMENRQKNYKEKLEHMKQPGFLTRLFNRM